MRIAKAIHYLKGRGKLPFLVTDLTDIKYITGFDGSNAYLVIGSGEAVLISDGRYAEYATSI
ncbi:MAG TPA: aminopeptidase P family N-terminal domain-containing protein, partial [Spirochaetota bacterium]|nr:aminopeptidase P family N-terminal domain-containing protein [Spirochaetota bacterium]